MPFTLVWTTPAGPERLEVATAQEAVTEYGNLRLRGVARPAILDERGEPANQYDLVKLTSSGIESQ